MFRSYILYLYNLNNFEGLGRCMLVACRFWSFVLFRPCNGSAARRSSHPRPVKVLAGVGRPILTNFCLMPMQREGFFAVSPTTTQGSREGVSVKQKNNQEKQGRRRERNKERRRDIRDRKERDCRGNLNETNIPRGNTQQGIGINEKNIL